MKQNKKKHLWRGIWFLLTFLLWTALIRCVDVQAIGPNGTKVGFSALNLWFHHHTGVHMTVYTITDWLGLVPIIICMGFGVLGLVQLVKRRSLLMVDSDILLLGAYYVVVILGYLLFEMMPINYRPILSILSVMIFIVTRQPYAGIICFAFLVVKDFLIAKGSRSHAA